MTTANEQNEENASAMPNRRKFIVTGLGVAAAPLLSRVASVRPQRRRMMRSVKLPSRFALGGHRLTAQ